MFSPDFVRTTANRGSEKQTGCLFFHSARHKVRTAYVHMSLCSVRIVNFRPARTVYAVKIAVQKQFSFVYPDKIPLKLSNNDNFAFDICLFRFLSIVFNFQKNHQAFHVLQQSNLSFFLECTVYVHKSGRRTRSLGPNT